MQTHHLEVIPRIIDSSIAANYQKAEPTPVKLEEQTKCEAVVQTDVIVAGAAVAPTFTQRFFSTLKDYIIPILFVLLVIIIIYIVWKYFTNYRSAPVVVPLVEQDPTSAESVPDKPDLSKYMFTDDDSDADETNSKLSIIEEESEDESEVEGSGDESDEEENESEVEEESGEEEDESEAEEESEDDHDSLPSLITEPDFDAITNLINQPIDTYLLDEKVERFEYINQTMEDDLNQETDYSSDRVDNYIQPEDQEETDQPDDSMFNLTLAPPKPKAKKARKSKRVVL